MDAGKVMTIIYPVKCELRVCKTQFRRCWDCKTISDDLRISLAVFTDVQVITALFSSLLLSL